MKHPSMYCDMVSDFAKKMSASTVEVQGATREDAVGFMTAAYALELPVKVYYGKKRLFLVREEQGDG